MNDPKNTTANSPTGIAIAEALALHRQGNLPAAQARYLAILQREPGQADATYYLAMIHMQQGLYADGIALARHGLSVRKEARLHNLVGQAYLRTDQRGMALEQFEHAIALEPKFADAWGNRANTLADLDRLDEAVRGFDRALALRPDSAQDWANRGSVLVRLDRLEEALSDCDRATALDPTLAMAHYNRANVLRDLGQIDAAAGRAADERFDAALGAYSRAIELQPDFAPSYFGRGVVHLLRGDWAAGWRDTEYRLTAGEPAFEPLPDPRWLGERLEGEGLVIVTERWPDDALLFCRFAPVLAARGFEVTILTKPGLKPILQSLPGITIATSAAELQRPLRWVPIMSLPGVLGIRPDNVPAQVPYLKAEPEQSGRWAAQLGVGFKIGINWSAGLPGEHTRRNVPLSAFAPLTEIPDVRLISLQQGMPAGELQRVPFRERIETPDITADPESDAFGDTAALMTQLDAVMTCDASLAHLAGALARPTFVALPAIADWRWQLGRSDSPWYPGMQLFRQTSLGDWDGVGKRIAEAVAQMARGS